MPNAPSPAERPHAVPARRPADDQSPTEVVANHEGQARWGTFHLATVMFRRARQLRDGSRPRVQADGHKALRIAFLEVTAGAIPWHFDAPAGLAGGAAGDPPSASGARATR